MSLVGRAVTAIRNVLHERAEASAVQDKSKQLAENQQALAGMEELARKINSGNQGGLSMEEYNERLRKEGGGL